MSLRNLWCGSRGRGSDTVLRPAGSVHHPLIRARAESYLGSAITYQYMKKKNWNPAFETTSGGKKEAGTELQKSFRSKWETNNLTMHSKHCSINTHHWVQNLHSHPHKQLKEAPLSRVRSQMYVYFYCHLQEKSYTTLNSHSYNLLWSKIRFKIKN